jgi:hypothetical protein
LEWPAHRITSVIQMRIDNSSLLAIGHTSEGSLSAVRSELPGRPHVAGVGHRRRRCSHKLMERLRDGFSLPPVTQGTTRTYSELSCVERQPLILPVVLELERETVGSSSAAVNRPNTRFLV